LEIVSSTEEQGDLSKASTPEKPSEETLSRLELPDGNLLEHHAAEMLLSLKECRVIALIGPNDAGKTTLAISIYELLNKGPLDGFCFCGSKTLHGFEQLCHLGRPWSGRESPGTEVTHRSSGLKFFHLRIKSGARNGVVDYLLSERSGEDYRTIADDPSVISEFPEIGRADCVSIVVDGRHLADARERHNAISRTQLILQGLADGGTLSTEQRLAVVLTKCDEIAKSSDVGKVYRDFDTLVHKLRRLFEAFFCEIASFHTAARPVGGNLPYGYGLSDLFQFWAKPLYYAPYEYAHLIPAPRIFSRVQVLGGC
jgi:energy-coupling factor transporter ATP-binding protein EcfA2